MNGAELEKRIQAVTDGRAMELARIFRSARSEVTQMATAAQLASIGTKRSASEMLNLIQRFIHDERRKNVLVGSFVLYSSHRHESRKELEALFEGSPEDIAMIKIVYADVQRISKRFLSLRPLSREIIDALR